jgi:hypothetical protein
MRVCAWVQIPVCPEPPLVFSHELLSGLRTGFLVVFPLLIACVFLHVERGRSSKRVWRSHRIIYFIYFISYQNSGPLVSVVHVFCLVDMRYIPCTPSKRTRHSHNGSLLLLIHAGSFRLVVPWPCYEARGCHGASMRPGWLVGWLACMLFVSLQLLPSKALAFLCFAGNPSPDEGSANIPGQSSSTVHTHMGEVLLHRPQH